MSALVQSVGTDRTPEARFRAVPGGKTGTLSGHISARRGDTTDDVMRPPDSNHTSQSCYSLMTASLN